jgi:hypothetical protein
MNWTQTSISRTHDKEEFSKENIQEPRQIKKELPLKHFLQAKVFELFKGGKSDKDIDSQRRDFLSYEININNKKWKIT